MLNSGMVSLRMTRCNALCIRSHRGAACCPNRPSNVWNQYDYYLVTSAAYSSTKKACKDAVHALYSYDDASIWAINSRYIASEPTFIHVEAFTITGEVLFNATFPIPALSGDETARLGAGPDPGAIA